MKQPPFMHGIIWLAILRSFLSPVYSFHHKILDNFTAAIENNLNIDAFEELPENISNCWYNVEKQGPGLPMSYELILVKE